MEKFTEDILNLHYFQITEHVRCRNSSKSYDEEGEGIWIHKVSVYKEEKNIYLSDKFLPHFILKLLKPILKGD